jgi:hypothetical protein
VKLVFDYLIWCKKSFGTPWHVTATEDCGQEDCLEILRIYPKGNPLVWSLIPELFDDTDDELDALSWDGIYALLSKIQESDIDTVKWEDVKELLGEEILIHSGGVKDSSSGGVVES